jgi:lipopolysaccharide transport system ATP-binding protein
MSSTVIKVESLSKQYRLGTVGTGTLAHDLNRWWCNLRGKPDPYLQVTRANERAHKSDSDYVWALRDINFKVEQGEVLGIIGANGAGKSTLLKILSRVTAPTEGSVKVKGRVGALLEVGTGFHPELTGRENIFLNGAILGMTKAEIRGKLDEIVDFSGCERYLDTPVKRYSSGMMVRLGFAVAAHLEPEILIVDEVLAVGDAEFQKKCLGKLKDVAEQGRTVLFVSHNMNAMRSLCTRGVLLQDGAVSKEGQMAAVVDSYLGAETVGNWSVSWDDPQQAPGSERARIKSMRLSGTDLEQPSRILTSDGIRIEYQFFNLRSQRLNISTHLRSSDGSVVFNVCSHKQVMPPGVVSGALDIPANFLNDGLFSLDFLVVTGGRVIASVVPGVSFQVHDHRDGAEWFGKYPGAIRPVFLRFPLTVVSDFQA